MYTSRNLFYYISKIFINYFVIFLLTLFFIFFLVESIEGFKRSANLDVDSFITWQLVCFKVSILFEKIFPFLVFFASIATYRRLTITHELAVVRAIGYSAWRFVTPAVVLSIMIAIFNVTVLSIYFAYANNKYSELSIKYLNRNSIFSLYDPVKSHSFVLDLKGMKIDENGYIYVDNTYYPIMDRTSITFISDNPWGINKIYTNKLLLKDGKIVFSGADIFYNNQHIERGKSFEINTTLDREYIDSFRDGISGVNFWKLPDTINKLRKLGFSTRFFEITWMSMIASPIIYVGLCLLGCVITLQNARRGGGALLIGLGIILGFIIYFFSSTVQTLGLIGVMSPFIAVFSPNVIVLLVAFWLVLKFEDG